MLWQGIALFFVTFAASVFSGMAGGGGGFILTPFYILLGLTPQQTVATLKFASFGLSAGAFTAFRARLKDDKKLTLFVMTISVAVGLAASRSIVSISNSSLQKVMALLILAMVPFMIVKKSKALRKNPAKPTKVIGTAALILVLFLQGVAGSGVGSLVSVIFMLFFGTTALEANVLKRKSAILLNIIVVLGLLGSGLINYKLGLFGMAGGLLGGYVGSHIAIKKGEDFARYALVVFMIVAGVWLLFTAK